MKKIRTISAEDLEELRYAKSLLEHTSLAARIVDVIGTPIERGLQMLPASASQIINAATTKALRTALDFAISSMDERPRASATWLHKTAAAVSGAAGGAFGLPALAVELPVSTTIMLRSIADIARSEGERIKSVEAKLACLQVFALGGRRIDDDAAETGYFAVRAALAKTIAEAAEYLAERGIAQEAAPPLVRFVSQLAARFGVPVSEKAIAQSVPIVGAAGGAIINTLFIDHFQDLARGHFIVRRLERAYDPEIVEAEFRVV